MENKKIKPRIQRKIELLEMCSIIAGRVRSHYDIDGRCWSGYSPCYDGYSGFVSTGSREIKHKNSFKPKIIVDLDYGLEITSCLFQEDFVNCLVKNLDYDTESVVVQSRNKGRVLTGKISYEWESFGRLAKKDFKVRTYSPGTWSDRIQHFHQLKKPNSRVQTRYMLRAPKKEKKQ